jgi:hypothetical protein
MNDTHGKLGFSGTRQGMDKKQTEDFLMQIKTIPPREFHHGSCCGADVEAARLVRQHVPGCRIVAHPGPANCRHKQDSGVDDEVRPCRPYRVRNCAIVNETAALFAAPFSADPDSRSGTWMTIRHADQFGFPHISYRADTEQELIEKARDRNGT